jgi:hypothetical protein
MTIVGGKNGNKRPVPSTVLLRMFAYVLRYLMTLVGGINS